MSRRLWIGIIIAVVASFIGLRLLFFNKMEVRDVDWTRDYSRTSEEAYGMNVFDAVLGSLYDYVNIDSLMIDDYENTLFVSIRKSYFMDSLEIDSLRGLAQQGQNFLIISDYIGSRADSYGIYSDAVALDSLSLFIGGRSYAVELQPDREKETYILGESPKTTFSDSVSCQFMDADRLVTTPVLRFIDEGDGVICLSTTPFLFSNIYSYQAYYRPFLEGVLSRYDVSSYTYVEPVKPMINDSPLQHILGNRSLKYAYYLLLSTMLMYITVGAKRKERAIPLLQEKKNTIMEFTDTVSRLYKGEGSYKKLASRLADNFYHHVESRYFLHRTTDDFWDQVAKKSRVEKNLINGIKNRLKPQYIDDISSYSELEILYKLVERFKKEGL